MRENFGSVGVGIGTLFFSFMATAAMPEKDYIAALKVAESKVLHEKEVANRSGALSSGMVKLLFGRNYEPGDSWEVVAWQVDLSGRNISPAAGRVAKARLSNPNSSHSISNAILPVGSGIFQYVVENVSRGAKPTVTLKVSQVEQSGLRIVDPKVRSITLKMTDGISQSEKFYSMTDMEHPVRVFADTVRSKISPLELFPLDVPDLTTADKKSSFSPPVLPPSIQRFLGQLPGRSPEGSLWDLSRSSWFEQDDFFGRTVQVLWQQGDPWPAYMKTSNGIAILLRRGAQ